MKKVIGKVMAIKAVAPVKKVAKKAVKKIIAKKAIAKKK